MADPAARFLAGERRAAFERWLRLHVPGFEQASAGPFALLDGGASNITCRVPVDGPAQAVVLRIQRSGGIFEPYDVIREGKLLRRLAKTPVPVPAVLGAEPDPTVIGAPFVVLEWVDAPHMGVAGPEADFGAYVRAVATVHDVDWRAAGLDFLGVPASPAEGVRTEVAAVAARMPAFGIGDDRTLLAARDHLMATAPGDGELRLCQGDINVFNYLFRERQVVAVVDWEQARIGDARSDIGQLLALAHLKGAPWGPAEAQPFAMAYQADAGRALGGLEWFRAFWLWQLAVIHHGWVALNGSQPWYTLREATSLLDAALGELTAR